MQALAGKRADWVPPARAALVGRARIRLDETMAADGTSRHGPAEPDVKALILAVADHGDRDAFAGLYRHFAPRLRAFLLKSGLEGGKAEDLVQDVMLTVWRRARLYDPAKASFSTWLFTIARNRRIDLIRRERRPELDPNDPALVPAPEPSADLALAARQDAAQLGRALGQLPTEQADLVRLAYFHDLSHRAIAEVAKLPLGTVKSRLRLAVLKLRRSMEDVE